MIDLRPLHRLVLLLPQSADPLDECTTKTIESLSTACFHAAFPMHLAQSAVYFAEHPEPKARKAESILEVLGLTMPTEKIQRRF